MAAAAPANSVVTRVDDLVIGRPLSQPVHDNQGILLLAGGAIITSEFKRQLKSRKIDSVRLHADDAKSLRWSAPELPAAPTVRLTAEIISRLDKTIEAGLLFTENKGPAAREAVIRHGKKAYDSTQKKQVVEMHTNACSSINDMMRTAVQRKEIDAAPITQMASTYLTAIEQDSELAVSSAMDVFQSGLAQHCLQMALLGMALGVEMGFDAENVRTIGVTGLLHDWGMVRVPAMIREAQRVLSPAEFTEIQKHPIYSLEMMERMPGIPKLAQLVTYQIHERPDGSGYPRGRTKNFIHVFARILNVADTYTALIGKRPHAPVLMPYAAMECLLQMARRQTVDSDVVRALLNVQSLFPVGSMVNLSDGSIARVLRPNRDKFSQPIVQLIQNSRGEPMTAEDPSAIIDLLESKLNVVQALPTPGREEVACTPDIITLNRDV